MSRINKAAVATCLAFAPVFLAIPASANEADSLPVVTVTQGGDDVSYQIPISDVVIFMDVPYQSIFATTNAVITFGRPDGTFWDYPMTPSISLGSTDWVAFPWRRNDEHFIITSTNNAFQVDMSARPFWAQNVAEPSRLILTGTINLDRTLSVNYYLENTEQYNLRFGVRTPTGEILSLEDAGFTESTVAPAGPGELMPPEPSPTPEPSPAPEPAPVEPEPQPEVAPSPSEPEVVVPVEPIPAPSPQPDPVATPEPVLPVEPEPVVPEVVEPEAPVAPSRPDPEPLPSPSPSPIPIEPEPTPEPEPLPDPTLEEIFETAEPGSPEYQAALDALMEKAQEDDIELPVEIAAIPLIGDVAGAVLEVFNNLGNVGADMSPEVRERSEEVIIASVIVGQVAQVASAGAVAVVRRKP